MLCPYCLSKTVHSSPYLQQPNLKHAQNNVKNAPGFSDKILLETLFLIPHIFFAPSKHWAQAFDNGMFSLIKTFFITVTGVSALMLSTLQTSNKVFMGIKTFINQSKTNNELFLITSICYFIGHYWAEYTIVDIFLLCLLILRRSLILWFHYDDAYHDEVFLSLFLHPTSNSRVNLLPANIGPQDVPRTSPKDPIWPCLGRLNLTFKGRPWEVDSGRT